MTIPTFPALTVLLRSVKLQWKNDRGVFDGYMRECGLLIQLLPAGAVVPHGYENAFFVEVYIYHLYYNLHSSTTLVGLSQQKTSDVERGLR